MLSKIPNSHADVMSNGCETSLSQFRDPLTMLVCRTPHVVQTTSALRVTYCYKHRRTELSSLCSVGTLIETFRANINVITRQ